MTTLPVYDIAPEGAWLPPWLGIGVVLLVLAAGLGGVKAFQGRGALSAEAARKTIHVLMGLVTLTFPWLFATSWPVVLLGALSLGLMVLIRSVRALKETVGTVLHSVERSSLGEIVYPVAVVLLFLLTPDDPVLYVVSILLLGIADPAAALVGIRHGLKPYDTVDGQKSREGSVAFVSVAFVCVHVPLLLFTTVGRVEALLVACIVAILAGMVEAVSWRGLDNFFVPVGAFLLLTRLLAQSPGTLALHVVLVLLLLGIAAAWRDRTTVGGAGIVGAALVGYVTWALGGWLWLVAPALVFALYARLWPVPSEPDRAHTAHNVFSVASVGIGWLLLSRALDVDLLVPYTIAYAVSLAFLGVERARDVRPERSVGRLVSRVLGPAWGVGVLALGVVAVASSAISPGESALAAGVLLVSVSLATWTLARFYGPIEEQPTDFEGRLIRAALGAPLSALGLIAYAV